MAAAESDVPGGGVPPTAGRGGSTAAVVGATGDPTRALADLLARDATFTERLRRDCVRLGLPALEVGVDDPDEALLSGVEAVLTP